MPDKQDIDFSGLYNQYGGPVYRYLIKLSGNEDIARDLLQEVFFAVFRYYDSYSEERGSFSTWIGTIARNLYYRQINREREIHIPLPDQIPDEHPEVTGEIEQRIIESDIRRFIEQLPEPHCSIIKYKFFDNCTLKECALRMEISESSVSRRLVEAYKLLKDTLKSEGYGL